MTQPPSSWEVFYSDFMPRYYIIDFDSTIIQTEALEELAEIALAGRPRRDLVLDEIKKITAQGMAGEIGFAESLSRRLALLECGRKHIDRVVDKLKTKITPSVYKNKNFFCDKREQIFVVSGSFREIIQPVLESLGLSEKNLFANTFVFDDEGRIIGVDSKIFLAQNKGKAKTVRALNLPGEVWVLGDGYTDYEIKEMGAADKFIAFTENASRPEVIAKADYVVSNFDEFLVSCQSGLF